MKRFHAAVLAAAVGSLGVVGCGSGSFGGPVASVKDDKTHFGTADDTFSLSVPTFATHLKQTESKVAEIGIKWGKNFGQDVSLMFDGLPKGVTADPASPEIKAGQENSKVRFKAADDAALGEFAVKVTGHPKTGRDATNEFKIVIAKK